MGSRKDRGLEMEGRDRAWTRRCQVLPLSHAARSSSD